MESRVPSSTEMVAARIAERDTVARSFFRAEPGFSVVPALTPSVVHRITLLHGLLVILLTVVG